MHNLTSNSSERYTPTHIVEAVRRVFGGSIDLDPASCAEANAFLGAKRFFTKDMDGLTQDWAGTTFLNPPGDKRGRLVKLFWKKAVFHASVGDVSLIWLGFNVNQLQTLQSFVDSPLSFPTCILNKRLHFVGPDGDPGDSPTCCNYITIVSKNDQHIGRFFAEFSSLGTIVQKRSA
jgi:hypothetical protein